MNKKVVLFVLVFSFFAFSGCNAGDLFLEAVKRTTPKLSKDEESFAPVNLIKIKSYGSVLTTKNNLSLYTYNKDSKNKSHCYDECAIIWPPFVVTFAEDVGGRYGVIARDDGTLQVTLDGQPLYTYTPDYPNEVTGDGKDGSWKVVVFQ